MGEKKNKETGKNYKDNWKTSNKMAVSTHLSKILTKWEFPGSPVVQGLCFH